MSASEFEQFAAAFGCPIAMAEPTVNRIRQRIGTDVPISDILAAIKKIAPSRLTTDTLVARLQKDAAAQSTKPIRADAEDDPDPSDRPGRRQAKSSGGVKNQIGEILNRNWAKAKESGITPPDLAIDKFVRTAQSAAGEPKPTVARVLEAVEVLAKRDVVITPNLVADEIIETDKV
jgi:hypothetical protein